MQPDVLFVVQSGGTGSIPNTLILVAQIGVTFLSQSLIGILAMMS